MLSLRALLPISLLLTIVTSSAIVQTSEQLKGNKEAQADLEEFERLLDQVDPPSLHAALHDYSPKKFTHGMFEKDRTAAEALHKEDASIASSIVALAKRQDISNGTVTTSTPPVVPGSTSTPEASDTVATPVPPITTGTETLPVGSPTTEASVGPASSTNAPITVTSTSTSPLEPGASSSSPDAVASASASASDSGAAATTPAAGTSPLTAGEVVTSTNAQGQLVTDTLSNGAVITSVNSQGVTIVTTVGGGSRTLAPSGSGSDSATTAPNASPHTTTSRRTTTLPDGSKSTVTAVTVVAASGQDIGAPSGTAGVGSASVTAAVSPGLQTGTAPKSISFGGQMIAVVGGAVGMAMMM